jgi:hypothetical protein
VIKTARPSGSRNHPAARQWRPKGSASSRLDPGASNKCRTMDALLVVTIVILILRCASGGPTQRQQRAADRRLNRSRIAFLNALGNIPLTAEQEQRRQALLAMRGGAPRRSQRQSFCRRPVPKESGHRQLYCIPLIG